MTHEIGVPDGSRARDFYHDLLGWASRPMGKDNFAMDTPTLGRFVECRDPQNVRFGLRQPPRP